MLLIFEGLSLVWLGSLLQNMTIIFGLTTKLCPVFKNILGTIIQVLVMDE